MVVRGGSIQRGDMRIAIVPYAREHCEAVQRFNTRVGASAFLFPDEPPAAGEEAYVAVAGGEVRGGYILRRQCFWIAGQMRQVAHYRSPLSEGIANKAYAGIGPQLLRSALQAEPLLYALGMGGVGQPLPRMLNVMGWSVHAVPFYARVLRPQRFLREIRALRTGAVRAAALEAARLTGAGWIGIRALQWFGGKPRPNGTHPDLLDGFGAWADRLWDEVKPRYALAAVRSSAVLNGLYGDGRFLRVRAGDAGWAVMLDTQMRDHKQFGNLRVGTIVDCLAAPEDAGVVVNTAARVLEERGVDVIVSNQAHAGWGDALKAAGFLTGPTNFVFAASKGMAGLVAPFETTAKDMHINRGDGDGPIHL